MWAFLYQESIEMLAKLKRMGGFESHDYDPVVSGGSQQ